MIKLTEPKTFKAPDDGVYIMQITDGREKENHIEIRLMTDDGCSLLQFYNKNSTGAMNAFTYLVRCALKDFNVTEISGIETLLGKFIEAEVVTNEGINRATGETKEYKNISNIKECSDISTYKNPKKSDVLVNKYLEREAKIAQEEQEEQARREAQRARRQAVLQEVATDTSDDDDDWL